MTNSVVIAELDHDEDSGTPGDGRTLAVTSLGLAIGAIVVPIVLSITAIVVAGIAKRRLGRSEGTRHHRSLANAAQGLAVLDFFAQAFILGLMYLMVL